MLLVALVWVHVLAVIAWFGGSALMAFVVGPALGAAGGEGRRATEMIATRSHRYYGIAGGLTILSGLLLAWAEGRFTSPLIWIVIVLAVFLAYWGARVTGKRADALARAGDAQRSAAVRQVIAAGTVELGLLAIAFTLMILVRFGY